MARLSVGKVWSALSQRVVVDAVKALGDIGVQHVFRLGLDGVEDGSDGIMA
jgi:hypothetical protein